MKGTGERGSMALETVLIAPPLILALVAVIAMGRITVARGSVEAAARDAARQASLARTPATARSRAQASATAALNREGIRCPARVEVDTSGFSRPVGSRATVTAHVTCTLELSDLAMPGIPGTRKLTASYSSPLDPYRGR